MKANRKRPPRSDDRASPRRGGQPGNQNARKHGFYSSLFKARELQLLDQLPSSDLSAEIELIRVTSARYLQSLHETRGAHDYEANLTALRAVNLSVQSIAMLLRAQAFTGALRHHLEKDLAEIEARLDAPDDAPVPA